jgi:electron transfer flavoprotein alpha subunit
LNVQLHALFLGPAIENMLQDVGARGARKLYLCANEGLRQYDPSIYEQVLGDLLKERQPGLLLALASSIGSDLLPRLAFKLGSPLVTRCADIEVKADGTLNFLKPVHSGRLFANIHCRGEGVKMATFLPERLTGDDEPLSDAHQAEIAPLRMTADGSASAIRVTGFAQADHRTIDITEAQVIVAIGRGLGAKENLAAVEAFADRIGGAIGGTRPMVDERILPYERQIGQTGKRVSPKLIFLCGISGAIEFTQGVRNPGASIAINSDPQAPILKSVDLGIVGNLNEVLPQLLEHISRATTSGGAAARSGEKAKKATSNGGQRK